MGLDKREALSSGFVPFLGNSGINLSSLGSTASKTLPPLEIAYSINSLGDRPDLPTWEPVAEKKPKMSSYDIKDALGNIVGWDSDGYYDALYKYNTAVALNIKNKAIYESNLDKYQSATGEWNNAVTGLYGGVPNKKPSSLLQSQGLGYQGLQGVNTY